MYVLYKYATLWKVMSKINYFKSISILRRHEIEVNEVAFPFGLDAMKELVAIWPLSQVSANPRLGSRDRKIDLPIIELWKLFCMHRNPVIC